MSRKRDVETRRADIQGVVALHKLVQRVAKTPAEFVTDPEMLAALASQGALAGFGSETHGISAMSLNHQKAISVLAIGSYEALNESRVSALATLKAPLSPPKRRRTAESDRDEVVSQMKQELSILKEDLFIIQRAYDTRCRQARSYAAKAGEATVALCQKEQREVDATMALRQRPGSPSVVPHRRQPSAQ